MRIGRFCKCGAWVEDSAWVCACQRRSRKVPHIDRLRQTEIALAASDEVRNLLHGLEKEDPEQFTYQTATIQSGRNIETEAFWENGKLIVVKIRLPMAR